VLARVGLRVSAGVAIGTINFLVSTLVLIGFGVVAITFLPSSLPGWLRVSTFSTLGVLVLLVVLGVLLLAKGRLPVTRSDGGKLRRAVHRVVGVARRSLDIARQLLRAEPRAVLGLFPITIALLTAKAVTTYFVFRAFEPEGHFQEMVAVLVLFILSLFFARSSSTRSGPRRASGSFSPGGRSRCTSRSSSEGSSSSISSAGTRAVWAALTPPRPPISLDSAAGSRSGGLDCWDTRGRRATWAGSKSSAAACSAAKPKS
jgi:hypothetical protein